MIPPVNHNRTFVVDFDNTIFDPKSLLRSIYVLCQTSFLRSLTQEEFLDCYKRATKMYVGVDINSFWRNLADRCRVRSDEILTAIMGLDFEQHVFPGAREFLTFLRERGQVIFFTEGDETWQTTKINKSGILSPEDEIAIYPDKARKIPRLVSSLKASGIIDIHFIDDRLDVIVKALSSAPYVHAWHIFHDRSSGWQPEYMRGIYNSLKFRIGIEIEGHKRGKER